jgi:hypothetical protein
MTILKIEQQASGNYEAIVVADDNKFLARVQLNDEEYTFLCDLQASIRTRIKDLATEPFYKERATDIE